MSKSELKQKALRGLVWSAIQKWGRDAASFLTFLVLSRLLAPEAFGLVALGSAFVLSLKVLLDQGFSAAIIQREELQEEHLDTAFWVTLAIGLLMTVTAFAVAPWVAALFSTPQLSPVLRWLSLGFVLDSLSGTQKAILQRQFDFKKMAARSLVASIVGGVVGISAALMGFGVWSLVAQVLAHGAAGAIVLWNASSWRPGFRLSRRHYNDLFGFGISVVANNLLKALMRRSDDFLIGFFLGPVWLGYYTIGYRLLLVVMRVVTGISNTVAFPFFARLQNDPDYMSRAFYRVTMYTSLLAFPVFFGLSATASLLVPVLFGSVWSASVPVMQVLALMGVLQSVTFFNHNIMRACGKPAWELRLTLINSLCSVAAFSVAVHWGIVAVAMAYVAVGFLLSPLSYLCVRRLLPLTLHKYLSQFVAPLIASVAMVLAIVVTEKLTRSWEMSDELQLLGCILVGGTTYVSCILLTARHLVTELMHFGRLLRQRDAIVERPAYGSETVK